MSAEDLRDALNNIEQSIEMRAAVFIVEQRRIQLDSVEWRLREVTERHETAAEVVQVRAHSSVAQIAACDLQEAMIYMRKWHADRNSFQRISGLE